MTELEPVRTAEDMFEEVVVAIREQSTKLDGLANTRSRTSPGDKQLDLVNDALRRISALYDQKPPFTARQLGGMGDAMDEQDWKIIRTAPFLVWYLDNYHNLSGPVRPKPAQDSNFDDVPF